MQTPVSIYLHIPFCRSKCTYCAFNTYTRIEHLIPRFVTAIAHEIRLVAENNPELAVHTVFFGGGTPSLLRPEQISQIMETIRQGFRLTQPMEITLEANPNDITEDYARGLYQAGINRISLGVQSTNSHELKLFARRHDNDEIAEAVRWIRAAGFKRLNLDLIYGIPHQTMDSWNWTLEQVCQLKPDHLSLYALGLETGTPLNDWVQQGQLSIPDDDITADMYEHATDKLPQYGFAQYEISNWAVEGQESIHNLQYWRNKPYLGFGPGAHGYAADKRYWTILSPEAYISALENADKTADNPYPLTPATDESVAVSRDDEIAETLIMGLRLTQEGIIRSVFSERFGTDIMTLHEEVLNRFANLGLVEITPEQVRLTRKGRMLSNTLFRELV